MEYSKKIIWIFNHYIVPPFIEEGHRHSNFAKYLEKKGYSVYLFYSSKLHNRNENTIKDGKKYKIDNSDKGKYVAIRTRNYRGNGIQRILNMFDYFFGLFKITKEISKIEDKPDIIYASSVHLLTCLAGIIIARRYKVKCIVEIRDLWPESLVAYGIIKTGNPLLKFLYMFEKWIYKRADKIIFTMEGGVDYIKEKGWDNQIDLSKVNHINNGVDLEAFDNNVNNIIFDDNDLSNEKTFKVIYSGSIRKANNIELIINAAKYIKEQSDRNIKFIIFGDGNDREPLEKKCMNERITNVVFKGRVDRKYIPYILSKADLNILNYRYNDIWKYGGSQNKNFEYLASGRPILSTVTMGYDIIEKYGAGISLSDQSEKSIGDAIIKIANMDNNYYLNLCKNARKAANLYNFKILTDKLVKLF
jgi:glycosyltransferase involved in cell wall biosynthesis